MDDGFFWHLLIAHAWILYSQFHVDAGEPGKLLFYPNTVNRNADWSRPESLNVANPYDAVDRWRAGTRPGEAMPSVRRLFGRLLDDAWHTALFTQPMPDFPATLRGIMENVAGHRDGRLAGIESEFYREVESICQRYHPTKRALEASEVCGTGRPEGQGVAPYPSAVAAI